MSAIGDVLHATPVAEAIKNTWPEVRIGWAVHPHCKSVLKGNPSIFRIHEVPRKPFLSGLMGIRKELRDGHYDVVLDLQGLMKSAAVCLASGANLRVGPAEAREGASAFYHQKISREMQKLHVIDGYLAMAEALGANINPAPKMRIQVSEEDKGFARGLLYGLDIEPHNFIVLNPGAGHLSKQWNPIRFAQVAEILGRTAVITGGPGDMELAQKICEVNPKVINLVGKTNLNQLAAVLKNASVFVGGDTGPMHIAQAVGCRVVALFGPTNPNILGPKGDHDEVVSSLQDYEGVGTWIQDIVQGDMNQISVDSVVAAVTRVISAR